MDACLVIGFVLNLTGWAGNVFLLGSMWEQAGAVASPPMHSPFSPLTHAILQFVSDFVLAFVLCAVYWLASASWRRSRMALAFICGVIVWRAGCRCVISDWLTSVTCPWAFRSPQRSWR